MSLSNGQSLLNILEALSNEIAKIDTSFDPKHDDFKTLKRIIKAPGEYSNHDIYLGSALAIRYTQLVCLVTISMSNGIFIPDMQQLTYTDGKLSCTWGNNASSHFTFGKIDSDCQAFTKQFQIRVLNYPNDSKFLSRNSMKLCLENIRQYHDIITAVKNKLSLINTDKNSIRTLLNKELQRDLLFILLASFPSSQINALFLHIQTFFPEDLEIKNANGISLNISRLFESPSEDIAYLIQKVNIYFDLYYSANLPIIRHITQSKTKEFILKLLDNKTTLENTIQNVDNIINNQVTPRLHLYKLFTTHLDKLLA